MPETKEAALALIPKASLEVLRRQLVHSREQGNNISNYDRKFNRWLIPLLEAEIKRREAHGPKSGLKEKVK